MSLSADAVARGLGSLVGPEAVVKVREPLAPRTTLRVGGEADCYVEPAGEEELARVVRFCDQEGIPILMLGRGSNLLVRDGGIRGVVVNLARPAFSGIEREGEGLRCGAGARLKAVAQAARDAGLGDLEFLEGIPASLGGALRMNAGSMGSHLFDVVWSVRMMDRRGEVMELRREAIEVGYRACPVLRDRIALGAMLVGVRRERELIEGRRQQYSERRWATQPAAPSAGCIFKNPGVIPAGRLIEELGLKGVKVGGAVVSDVHANFIVNEGGATAHDVLRLIDLVRERARMERGIELETEVEIVGEAAGLRQLGGE